MNDDVVHANHHHPTVVVDVPPEVAAVEDIWSASEGYTPLCDIPSEEGELFTDGGSTTFYASYHPGSSFLTQLASAFGDDDGTDNDDDVSLPNGDWKGAESLPTTSGNDDAAASDFRAIADHALMNLECDYKRTIAYQSRPMDWSEPVQTESFFSSCFKEVDDAILADDAGNNFGTYGLSPPTIHEKILPDIDTEAVRRAVQSMQLQNPKLKHNLQQWERARNDQAASRTTCSASSGGSIAPRIHPIVPAAPLAAFYKQTTKAINATANLSRSATIAEALRRLDLLKRHWNVVTTLRIHLIGCDHVECESPERLRVFFGPIVRWIGAAPEAPTHIRLDVIGPNVPNHAAVSSPLDLLPSHSASGQSNQCLQSATLCCHVGLYNDWLSSTTDSPTPDLVVAFNAGIWGYTEWATTIDSLIQQHRLIPFIITAYTLEEAEDDEDVIKSRLSIESVASRCEWEPEANPFASAQIRDTRNAAEGRIYRENAAWQCWRF